MQPFIQSYSQHIVLSNVHLWDGSFYLRRRAWVFKKVNSIQDRLAKESIVFKLCLSLSLNLVCDPD